MQRPFTGNFPPQTTLKRDFQKARGEAFQAEARAAAEDIDPKARSWRRHRGSLVDYALRLSHNNHVTACALLYDACNNPAMRVAFFAHLLAVGGPPGGLPSAALSFPALLRHNAMGEGVEQLSWERRHQRSAGALTMRHTLLGAVVAASPAPAPPADLSADAPAALPPKKLKGTPGADASDPALARAMGTSRDKLGAASEWRRVELELHGWIPPYERRHGPHVPEEVRLAAARCWVKYSIPSPCKKDIARLRIAPNVFAERGILMQELTNAEAFYRFRTDPEFKEYASRIHQRSFDALKPYFVRRRDCHEVCLCGSCLNAKLALVSFHVNMVRWGAAEPAEGRSCKCGDHHIGCPAAHQHELKAVPLLFSSLSTFTERVLCHAPDGESVTGHASGCVDGTCGACGIKRLKWCPHINMKARDAEWSVFDKDPVSGRLMEHKVEGTRGQFLAYFKEQIARYIPHIFLATWQKAAIKSARFNLQPGQLWLLVDFSENYTPQFQKETMATHWEGGRGITVLPIIVRYLAKSPGAGSRAPRCSRRARGSG